MTSVLQTTAGKMIFGRLWDDGDAPATGTLAPALAEVKSAPALTRISDTES